MRRIFHRGNGKQKDSEDRRVFHAEAREEKTATLAGEHRAEWRVVRPLLGKKGEAVGVRGCRTWS